MKLIVGLGNPGKEYDNTRHNSGFLVMDTLAAKLNISYDKQKFQAVFHSLTKNGETIFLVKPQTFMNNSGEAIQAIMKFYKMTTEDLIIIYDDISLPVGKIRLRQQGSSAGQNGIKSIIAHLHTQNFNRIRIGVGKDERVPLIDWVLGKIRNSEKSLYIDSINDAVMAIEYAFEHDFTDTMNHFNKK